MKQFFSIKFGDNHRRYCEPVPCTVIAHDNMLNIFIDIIYDYCYRDAIVFNVAHFHDEVAQTSFSNCKRWKDIVLIFGLLRGGV